jgi:hypothetical protein
MSGLFGDFDINNAATSGGQGLPLGPGEYVAEITNSKGSKLRKGVAFEMFFRVVEAAPGSTHAPGHIFNEFCPLHEEWGPGKAKTVLTVAYGLDPNSSADAADVKAENWTKVMEMAATKPEIFNGRKVRVSVVTSTAKVSKKLYERRTFNVHEDTRKLFQELKAKKAAAEKK